MICIYFQADINLPHPQGWCGVVGGRLLCYQNGASRHLPLPVLEPGSDRLSGKGKIKPIALFQMQNPQRLCPLLRHKNSLSAVSPNHLQCQQCTVEQLHESTTEGGQGQFSGHRGHILPKMPVLN